MDKFKAIHYDKLYSGTVNIDHYERIKITAREESSRDTKGRVAYLPLNLESSKSVKEQIAYSDESENVWPKTGKTLYVSKDSHVPRALLRNSDYKITIDPDKADYVVVPELTDDDVSSREDDLIYIRTSDGSVSLFYFTLNRGFYNTDKLSDETIKNIEEKFKEAYTIFPEDTFELIYNSNGEMTTIYFVKNYSEIEQILTGNMTRKYIVDTRIRLTPPTEMTAEALQIWSKMGEGREMMAKAIIASDWQKHPCTTCVFINAMGIYWNGGEQMKYVKKCIGYSNYEHNRTFPPHLVIQPEDWNLLQDWLMLRAGLKPEGGFKVHHDEDGDTKFVRHAVCVKPLRISEPMTFQDIEARLKN